MTTVDEINQKIGRNDPCPCGSGKKYKKCCYSRNRQSKIKAIKANFGLLKTYFRTFNEKDLFSTLGALQIIPDNDCHAIRLAVAAQIACSITHFGNKDIDLPEFIEHLNKFLLTDSEIGLEEDPPEYLFTENIVFNNGNNVVYPSIYHEENDILEDIISLLNSYPDKFPTEFIDEVMPRILAILTLSNSIASKLYHTRYMDTVHDWTSKREDIEIPEIALYLQYKNAVIFQKKDLEPIISPIDDILRPFYLTRENCNFQKDQINSHKLVRAPLINYKNTLIILNPISLLCAVRHYIIKTAIKFHIEANFTTSYRKVLWNKTLKYLYLMGYDYIDYSFPEIPENLPILEGLFRIDSNKLVYVQLISDTTENYDELNPKGNWELNDTSKEINKRDFQIIRNLKGDFNSYEFFILKIFGHIGRGSRLAYNFDENTRTLLISAENLKIISLSGKCERLTLWKYVKAYADAFNYYYYVTDSFLDLFALYEERGTLILEPLIIPKVFPIPTGYGKKIRMDTKRINDDHCAEVGVSGSIILASVNNAYHDPSIPIYQLKEPVWNYFGYVIEGYNQPVWVFYYKDVDKCEQKILTLAMELLKPIAYWLFQVTPSLKKHLEPLGEAPLHIFIQFEDIGKWENIREDEFECLQENGSFHIQFQGRAIFFEIPNSFIKQLKGSDNNGERVLLRALLKSFAKLITKRCGTCDLTDKSINEIVEIYAPLGIKKQMFLFMDSTEGLLINNNLPPLRLIQYHDIQEQSLGIITELTNWNFANLQSNRQKDEVCKAIVEIYVKRLKRQIKNFYWKDLLNNLIGTFDAVLHTGKKIHVFSPYQEACFPNDSVFIQRLMEDRSKIDQTLTCVRTLIEVIIAEPPNGSKITNSDDLDKMLAIIHNIIEWATVADLFYYNLLKSDFIFGAGGRIITPMQDLEKGYTAFLKEKTQESLEGSYNHYKEMFDYCRKTKNSDKSSISREMNEAIIAEFGLNINQISRFFSCLIHSTELFICPEQQGPVYTLSKNEFKKRIIQSLNWKEREVDRALDEFSLSNRKKWENPPKGFTFEADIAPWKFRRRLSHARRPLLIGPEPKEDPIILWGSLNSERALTYIGELIDEGRYDPTYSVPEMRSYIAEILKIKGEAFTHFIEKWFKRNTKWFIRANVPIPFGSDTSASENLGDIDILAIDEKREIIYSIECKNLNFGRNAREMANEIIRLYQGSDEEEAWVIKHKKRDKWLKINYKKILLYYSLPLKQYKIKSFVLTSEVIPSLFLHEIDPDMPVYSFTQLEKGDLKLF